MTSSASARLHGLMPILATPFQPDGVLDRVGLRRVAEFQLHSGADAVATLGVASEAFALTETEADVVVAEVLDVVAGSCPVVVGVGVGSERSVRERIERLAARGVSRFMVLPAFLVKPNEAQVGEYFQAAAEVAHSVGGTVMLQDAPITSGVTLSLGLLRGLAELPAVDSMKIEAPPTLTKFADLAGTVGDVVLIGGLNAQFVIDEYLLGSRGTMPACEFTDLLRPLIDDLERGDLEQARGRYAQLLPLIIWGLQPGIAHAMHKEVLVARGLIDSSRVRVPANPLPDGLREPLAGIVENLGVVRRRAA